MERCVSHTSLATVGQIAWRMLELHGLEPAPLFAEQGIGIEILQDPNARIPSQKWDALTRRAAERDPGPGFALVAAKCWHPSNLGALGFAWLSSSTLRTGLQRLIRYWKLLGERSSLHLIDTGTAVKLVVDSGRTDPVISGLVADFQLSLIFSMCQLNYREGLRPLELSMRYVWPGEQQAYERHFECPVVCSAAEDSITLAASDLDKPLPTGNRQIAATLDKVLAEQLAHLDKNNVVARCKASLLEQLCAGELHAGLFPAERVYACVQALDRGCTQRVPAAPACRGGAAAPALTMARADGRLARVVKPGGPSARIVALQHGVTALPGPPDALSPLQPLHPRTLRHRRDARAGARVPCRLAFAARVRARALARARRGGLADRVRRNRPAPGGRYSAEASTWMTRPAIRSLTFAA
jgi:hypothetical protein